MGEMDDLVTEFLVESHENLDRLDTDLLALESHPNARELLAGIFRSIHTIKGTCGFLGFGRLESLTHVGENLLSLLRDGKVGVDSETTSALLSLVDATRRMLGSIEKQGSEGPDEFTELKETLTRLQGEFAKPVKRPLCAASPASATAAAATGAAATGAAATSSATPTPAAASAPAQAAADAAVRAPAPSAPEAVRTPDPAAATAPASSSAVPAAAAVEHSVADSSIRVDVG